MELISEKVLPLKGFKGKVKKLNQHAFPGQE